MARTPKFNFFLSKLPQYPSDSKPNTIACSKFEFPFDCQKGYRNSHETYEMHGFTSDQTGLVCILIWACFYYMFAITNHQFLYTRNSYHYPNATPCFLGI